jgi:hypothetical protein
MLRPGDLVLSRSETDPHGKSVLLRIEEVFVRRVQSLQILSIRSSCGTLQTLYTTQVHPVYINTRGWVDAAHIQVGDQILEPTGGLATILASRFETYPDGILVYNFRVATAHTSYFVREQGSTAAPLWVHNSYETESIRINPEIPGRPDPAWSIDTTTFVEGEFTTLTKNGGYRDRIQFWDAWAKKRPETLSEANLEATQTLQSDPYAPSPTVDEQWIKHFPEHADFLGDTLVHHHVQNGPWAIPLPETTHVRRFSVWH